MLGRIWKWHNFPRSRMNEPSILKDFKIDSNTEVVIENQRGITLFGFMWYSPHLLVPKVDPPQYQIVYFEENKEHNGDYSINISLSKLSNRILRSFEPFYPLDFVAPGVQLPETKWHILMSIEDTDDDGWNYSWAFGSRHWKYRNGLVRRRVWVRLPVD